MYTAFDIETGPQPREVLDKLIDPFPPFQPPGPFDPASVKYGNTKDEAKRAEKLDEARAKHAEAASKAEEKYAIDKAAYEASVIDKAALDARHGRVIAIGFQNDDNGFWAENSDDEREVLKSFWSAFDFATVAKTKLVGHNCLGFDLPFIIQRSWITGVAISPGVLDKGKWWHECLVDTMVRWQCANFRSTYVSLDSLARVLGVGAKNGDGAAFAKLWAEDRKQAIAYLQNDLDITYQVAYRLGVR
jgi:3'-5' exonuclease